MRAPEFWRADGAVSRVLSPLGRLYGAIARRRLRRDAPRAALPTIVVGGLTSGGDGKTPLVITLASLLAERGERPALLTRGYGRSSRRSAPFLVSPKDNATTAGDEALLLSRRALTIVGADRWASAKMARELGATVVILDDGFHSRQLAADISLLVVDSDYGAGNGRCLPAGPLRAPLRAQLEAADVALVIGDGPARRQFEAQCTKPVFRARMTSGKTLAGARVIGFAGIGRPEKFFRTLAQTGAEIVATRAFPDHHRFSAREIARLAALSRRYDAELVTTEKDAVRLPPGVDCDTLAIDLVFGEPGGFVEKLLAAVECARLSRAS